LGQMFKFLIGIVSRIRRPLALFASVVAFVFVASCSGVNLDSMFSSGSKNAPDTAGQQSGPPAKVALLLPLSAPGKTASIASAMKKAAELALFEAGKSSITLITKDTHGNKAGAAAAAQAAIAEGAEIILGPLLGSEVVAVTPLAAARNIPIIAFSSVSAVARPNVYLMSFLPEEEVSNLINHASRSGLNSVVALIPQSQYGAVIERALKAATKRVGTRIISIERFNRNGSNMAAAAARIARAVNNPARPAKAVFIPEGPRNMQIIGNALMQAGFAPGSARVLGTGLWDSPATKNIPLAIGGWYAGVTPQKVSAFTIYERLKLTRKISKDKLYKSYENLLSKNYIHNLEKFQHQKAIKKLYLCDTSLKSALSIDKHFGRLFENMVFLELLKSKVKCFYAQGIDFYIFPMNKIS